MTATIALRRVTALTEIFQQQLEVYSGKKLKLRINDNRSTMLSVRWNPDHTMVSLHRMFLEAPQNIMEDVACYLAKPKKGLSAAVKAFIENGSQRLDYSSELDLTRLDTKGQIHDLELLYNEVNQRYFAGKLDLRITWAGAHRPRNRSRVGLGRYCHTLKLIRIHRVLDQEAVPAYVVAFIIFHEILHHTHPPVVLSNGRNQVHHKEFHKHEALFDDYKKAQEWLYQHRALFFVDAEHRG